MKNITWKIWLEKFITIGTAFAFMIFMVLSCSSSKKKKTILPNSNLDTIQVHNSNGNTTTAMHNFALDDHIFIRLRPPQNRVKSLSEIDSMAQYGSIKTNNENESIPVSNSNSPVAARIVENYNNSKNKEPNGHCLSVSKGRFERAYKEVHGHSIYQDLPASMATTTYTPKQVFNLLYDSASDLGDGWQSLPVEYRGKGNAGAIAYADMGTVVDSTGIWSGQLQPGALMQVWRFKEDYEQVVRGANVKKIDPFGHSFIFISYLRNDQNAITGLKIADQGFQSYRPLIPSDYEVWWAVNLSI